MTFLAVKESRKRYGLVIYSHLKGSVFRAVERKAEVKPKGGISYIP